MLIEDFNQKFINPNIEGAGRILSHPQSDESKTYYDTMIQSPFRQHQTDRITIDSAVTGKRRYPEAGALPVTRYHALYNQYAEQIHIYNPHTNSVDTHDLTPDEVTHINNSATHSMFTHIPDRIKNTVSEIPLSPVHQLHLHLNQEAHDHFVNNGHDTSPGFRNLSDAVASYTSDSRMLNSYLLHKDDIHLDHIIRPFRPVPGLESEYERLDGFHKISPSHTRSFSTYSNVGDKLGNKLNKITEGTRFHSPAFISSSINPLISREFRPYSVSHLIKFNIPKGSKPGFYTGISSDNPDELEYVIHPNSTWKKTKTSVSYIPLKPVGHRTIITHHMDLETPQR